MKTVLKTSNFTHMNICAMNMHMSNVDIKLYPFGSHVCCMFVTFMSLILEIIVFKTSKLTYVHLCTTRINSSNLDDTPSILHYTAISVLFVTFISITLGMYALGTSNVTQLYLSLLCIYTSII